MYKWERGRYPLMCAKKMNCDASCSVYCCCCCCSFCRHSHTSYIHPHNPSSWTVSSGWMEPKYMFASTQIRCEHFAELNQQNIPIAIYLRNARVGTFEYTWKGLIFRPWLICGRNIIQSDRAPSKTFRLQSPK